MQDFNAFLQQLQRSGPGVGGTGGRAPAPQISQNLVGPTAAQAGPKPGVGGGGGRASTGGGGGGSTSGGSSFTDFFKGSGVKGEMEGFLRSLLKKSQKVLQTPAPIYKGDRVADPTKQLDQAKKTMHQAAAEIRNQNPRWSATAQSFLKPTTFSTDPALLGRGFTKPVAQPRAVPNRQA